MNKPLLWWYWTKFANYSAIKDLIKNNDLCNETPEIPYTFSMKKVEMAVSNIIHRKPVTNKDALSNHESLNFFEKIRLQLD